VRPIPEVGPGVIVTTKLPATAPFVRADPEEEALIESARVRSDKRMTPSEWIGSWASALSFMAAAVVCAVALPWPRELDPWLAVGLMAAYALSSRVRFYIGAGYTVPTQVVLVPMLFLLPTPLVPALVALAQLVGDLPDLRTRKLHPERALHSVGDSWYALAPALILTVTGATPFQPDLWPIYLFALAGQFVLDLTVNAVRDWFELGVPPRLSVTDNGWIYAVDALLAPVGLLAAAAGTVEPWLFALVVPQVVLLDVFARERQRRLDGALELRHAYQGTSALLAELLQDDDEYTGMHSKDVVSLAVAVATQVGLDSRRVRDTEFAALLHDIGKIALPKEIINKPGPLTEEEWAVMRTHTLEGQRMLDQVGGALQRVGVIVRASHERWDGRGYPDGLAGEEIPVEARIVSACDAFHAMTSDRSYRRALPVDIAVEELQTCAGSQFDPGVVAALVDVVRLSQPLAA
jgi:putative nucleotidyltransferase with HDIG domain